VSGVSKILHS